MVALAVLFLFALKCTVPAAGAVLGQAVPFVVDRGMSETTVEAVVPMDAGSVVCSFTFETEVEEEEQGEAEGSLSAEEAVASLFGQCARRKQDFWTYEVCIGGDVRQLHDAENFLLGRYASGQGAQQQYTDGTPCEAIGGQPGRTTTVNIECGPDFAVTSVQESTPCVYALTVTAPDACRSADIPKSTSVVDTAGPSGEPWLLEGNVLSDGSVECEVRFADDMRKAGATRGGIPMAGFQLRVRDGAGAEDAEAARGGAGAVFRLEDFRVWDAEKTDVALHRVNVCEDGHSETFVQNSSEGKNLALQFARISAAVMRT